MGYEWNFSEIATLETIQILFRGFGTTLLISGVAILVGTILGGLWGFGATSGSQQSHIWRDPLSEDPSISRLGGNVRRVFLGGLIDLVRSIPLLLFIFLCFYGLPPLADIVVNSWLEAVFGVSVEVTGLQSVLIAFSINLAAFIADLFRAGLVGFSGKKVRSGLSVGISRSKLMRFVVLPDLFREISPAVFNLYITIFKMSTLASAVAVYELLHTGNLIIQQTYRPLEVYSLIALFFVLSAICITTMQSTVQRLGVFEKRS